MQLPHGWSSCSLSDIAAVNPKTVADESLIAGFVPMSHAPTSYHGELLFDEKPWGEIKKSYTNFQDGDVIFAKVTPCFENGKAAIIDDLPNGIGAGSSEFYVLRPHCSDISQKLLFALIKTHAFMQEGATNMTGAVGLRRVPKSFVETFPIALPPAAEQKEIADRLDTLLGQVEATQARLARIPDIIKKFRQSVLSAATAGNLTKSKEEWIEADLSRVASHIVDCPHSTPKWSSSGYYCVRTTAFNEFFLDLSAQGFVSADVYEERIKRLTPLAGDILYSREGTIGIACQIPEGVELCLGQRMVLIRAGHLVNSKYLTIVLNSNKIISIVRQKNIGSTVPRINMSDIKTFPIPLPALEEQTEIVRRVEQLFAYADSIEQQAKVAKERVDNLTQAILAKAFRGELTADWRAANPDLISGDNSAAALLARIQAERATAKPRKRATKTSAA